MEWHGMVWNGAPVPGSCSFGNDLAGPNPLMIYGTLITVSRVQTTFLIKKYQPPTSFVSRHSLTEWYGLCVVVLVIVFTSILKINFGQPIVILCTLRRAAMAADRSPPAAQTLSKHQARAGVYMSFAGGGCVLSWLFCHWFSNVCCDTLDIVLQRHSFIDLRCR
jgi:hypothetical protein